MLNMLISPAYAQSTSSMFAGIDLMTFVPIIVMLGAFYFFIFRPQQKKMQAQREMMNNLSRGDQVIAAGGIIGKVSKIVNESEILIEIADEVHMRILRATITENLSKKSGTTSELASSSNAERKDNSIVAKKASPLKKKPTGRTKKS